MKLIKVGVGVLNQTPLGWEHNKDHILDAIEQARAADVSILCLPEMCIPGYGCQDAFHAPHVAQESLRILVDEIAPATRGIAVSVGLPLAYRNVVFNAVALVAGGEVAGLVCKQFLAGDGVHYEPRWFKPWPADVQGAIDLDGRPVPVGDLLFDLDGIGVGFEICEDAWVARRPGSDMAGRGIDLILNPSASHFAFDKLETRKRFVIEGSRAFAVTYLYANLLGNDAGRLVYDGGALIASRGELLAEGPRFGFEDVTLTTAVVDVERTRQTQAWTNSFLPNFGPARFVEVDFTWPELEPQARPPRPVAAWETSPHRKEEEFTRAVTLALFDYLRRSYSRGFVVSLSGGADSAACACLVGLMVDRAIAELGLEGFKAKLGYFRALADLDDRDAIVAATLTTAYQATRNSGDVTREAARRVAEAVGATHLELDVDAIVQSYVSLIEGGLGRELAWQTDDIALQNIQARARAPSVWMLANIRGALLVSTSNRSEAAVGYATMDGDTAGGISPIAGIDKAFLRRWLMWLQTEGPDGMAPIPALEAITAQQPTAELRPPEQGQTDEGDLMPYDLLDAIERAAIRDKQAPLSAFLRMRAEFPDIEPRQLGQWVERFFRLWCRNQWKRERYAPSFHVDDENLDPKTWCRFPILSGGFERELAALRAHVVEHWGA